MEIIVTGGRGYIGSKLVKRLACDSFDLIDGQDFRIDKACSVFDDYDIVIHLGAISDVELCEKDKKNAFDTNITGTLNVLNHSRKIIFASSAAVYGNTKGKSSVHSPTLPISYYGKTKLTAENMILSHPIDSTIFRIFNVHGYDGKSAIDKFKRDKKLKVYGDTYRDFITVDEVVNRIIEETQRMKGKNTYNLGTGIAQSIISMALDTGKDIVFLPKKDNDIEFSCSG